MVYTRQERAVIALELLTLHGRLDEERYRWWVAELEAAGGALPPERPCTRPVHDTASLGMPEDPSGADSD